MSAPVAQVLRDAAELIERDGWCQGDLRTADGAHCALGALFTVDTGNGVLAALAESVLGAHVDRLVPGWNDAPDRTVTEVLAALRACADEQDEYHHVNHHRADEQEASDEAPAPAGNKVVDLMAALEASVEEAKAARKRPRSEIEEASDG